MVYALQHRPFFLSLNKMIRRVPMELQLQHLCKQYGEKRAVNDVTATLSPGVYGLLGPKGA